MQGVSFWSSGRENDGEVDDPGWCHHNSMRSGSLEGGRLAVAGVGASDVHLFLAGESDCGIGRCARFVPRVGAGGEHRFLARESDCGIGLDVRSVPRVAYPHSLMESSGALSHDGP